MGVHDSRTLSVPIDRDWRAVYAFTYQPENFPLWASGLASGLERDGAEWIAQAPSGLVRIRFSPPNDFGVLDHTVVLPSGEEVFVPMRIVANGGGAEAMLTLFRGPGMTDETFARDADWVRRDLAALKRLLEHVDRPTG